LGFLKNRNVLNKKVGLYTQQEQQDEFLIKKYATGFFMTKMILKYVFNFKGRVAYHVSHLGVPAERLKTHRKRNAESVFYVN